MYVAAGSRWGEGEMLLAAVEPGMESAGVVQEVVGPQPEAAHCGFTFRVTVPLPVGSDRSPLTTARSLTGCSACRGGRN